MQATKRILKSTLGWALLHTCALALIATWGMFTVMEAPKDSVHRPAIPGYAQGWGE